MSAPRRFSFSDALIAQFDGFLQTLNHDRNAQPSTPSPANRCSDATKGERPAATGESLRVDIIDQVVSVALLRGRALGSRSDSERERLFALAAQGFDRVLWTRARLTEVKGSASHLEPLAYVSALVSGALAELSGSRNGAALAAGHCHSVEKRLRRQLEDVPSSDERSRALLKALADQFAQAAYLPSDEAGWRQWPVRLGTGLVASTSARVVRWL